MRLNPTLEWNSAVLKDYVYFDKTAEFNYTFDT